MGIFTAPAEALFKRLITELYSVHWKESTLVLLVTSPLNPCRLWRFIANCTTAQNLSRCRS